MPVTSARPFPNTTSTSATNAPSGSAMRDASAIVLYSSTEKMMLLKYEMTKLSFCVSFGFVSTLISSFISISFCLFSSVFDSIYETYLSMSL